MKINEHEKRLNFIKYMINKSKNYEEASYIFSKKDDETLIKGIFNNYRMKYLVEYTEYIFHNRDQKINEILK